MLNATLRDMVAPEKLVDLFLDINLLLVVMAGLWLALRRLFKHVGMAQAFTSQLLVLKTLLAAAFFVPVLHRLYDAAGRNFELMPANLSDLVVSQFVRGHVDMNAGTLERILFVRQNISSAIVAPESIWGQLLIGSVLLGAAFLLLRAVQSLLHLNRVLTQSYKWRQFGRLQLRVSDTIRVPFSTRTFGRQLVVLPSTMLGQSDDLKVALAHEIQHMRQRDVEWEIAATLLMPILYWNPAFHFVRSEMNELRELSCDQQVLRRTKLSTKAYCETLLRVCASRFERPALFQITAPRVALVEVRHLPLRRDPARQLWRRLEAALDVGPNRQPRWKSALLSVMLLGVFLMVSFAVGKPHDWTQDRLMLSTIVNLERLEQRNTFGVPPL